MLNGKCATADGSREVQETAAQAKSISKIHGRGPKKTFKSADSMLFGEFAKSAMTTVD